MKQTKKTSSGHLYVIHKETLSHHCNASWTTPTMWGYYYLYSDTSKCDKR